MVYIYNGILFSLKRKEILKHAINITCNKNTVPNDPQSPFVTSGIRLGTAAITSRGFVIEDMDKIAEAIDLVITDNEKNAEDAMGIVAALTNKYPLYED